MTTHSVLIIYGLFLMLGGFLGFKKGSKISLVMGLGSGILVLGGVWFLSFGPHFGWIFLRCLLGALSLVFLSRVIKTRAFMPSGMLLLITLAVLVFCLIK